MTNVKSFSKFKKTKIIRNNTMLCVSNLVFVFCFMMMHLAWAQTSGWLEKPNKNVIKTDTSGNVGAGVLNPTEKLDVNGNIRIRALEGDTDRIVIVDRFGKLKTISFDLLGGPEVPGPKPVPISLCRGRVVPIGTPQPPVHPSWNAITDVIPILHTCPVYTRVGIGTESPTGILHIVQGGIDRFRIGTGGDIQTEGANGTGWNNFGAANAIFPILTVQNNLKSEVMRVTSAGNVGIGTMNPMTKLHIENNGNVRITLKDASNPTGRYFQIEQDGNLVSFNDGGIKQIISMNLTSGNVGIGTTNIGVYKLNVAGNIRACEVRVDLIGCDFVFENSYDLQSLTKRKEMVLKNKHLPNIKQAKDMETNGANLGEYSSGLLQNIEEHELYLYNHDEKIENLMQRVEKLENNNKELKKENMGLRNEIEHFKKKK